MWQLLRENGCIELYSGDKARDWLIGKRVAVDLSIILAEILLGGKSELYSAKRFAISSRIPLC